MRTVAIRRMLGTRMRADSDQSLVGLAQKGDAHAFSELAKRHESKVYALCLRFMRDPVLAEDMAQEAFVKAFRLLKGFRKQCRFSTWLYRVTCSVCLSELDRRKRRPEITMDTPPEGEASSLAPEQIEAHAIIRQCVSRLPKKYATAVTLYYFEETSYEDIAKAMGIPTGTLKTWLHRARIQLRDIAAKELEGYGLLEP